MSSKKPSGMAKTLLFASAMATLISTGACNDDRKHVDQAKVQEYAQTIDSLDVYGQKAKKINGGRIESVEEWNALRDTLGQVRAYEDVLSGCKIGISAQRIEQGLFAFNKLDRFRNELLHFQERLNNTKYNRQGKFSNFSEYYSCLASLTKEHVVVGKIISAFGSNDLVFPLLIQELSETMVLMENVAPMLADQEEQTREVKAKRKVSSDLYYRLNFLLGEAHKYAF